MKGFAEIAASLHELVGTTGRKQEKSINIRINIDSCHIGKRNIKKLLKSKGKNLRQLLYLLMPTCYADLLMPLTKILVQCLVRIITVFSVW